MAGTLSPIVSAGPLSALRLEKIYNMGGLKMYDKIDRVDTPNGGVMLAIVFTVVTPAWDIEAWRNDCKFIQPEVRRANRWIELEPAIRVVDSYVGGDVDVELTFLVAPGNEVRWFDDEHAYVGRVTESGEITDTVEFKVLKAEEVVA